MDWAWEARGPRPPGQGARAPGPSAPPGPSPSRNFIYFNVFAFSKCETLAKLLTFLKHGLGVQSQPLVNSQLQGFLDEVCEAVEVAWTGARSPTPPKDAPSWTDSDTRLVPIRTTGGVNPTQPDPGTRNRLLIDVEVENRTCRC